MEQEENSEKNFKESIIKENENENENEMQYNVEMIKKNYQKVFLQYLMILN